MSEWLEPVMRWAVGFINANIITALIGFAGALGGARAAQKLAERAKTRDELEKQVRDTGAAAILVYGMVSRHLEMKQQNIKELRDQFFQERERFGAFLKAREAGNVPPAQIFEYNLYNFTFRASHAPTEQIAKLVFEQTTLPASIFLATHTMLSAYHALNGCLEDRNELSREVAAVQAAGQKFSPFRYFGFQEKDTVDLRFKFNVENIYSQNDDVIAFGIAIADRLYEHANGKREGLRKRFKVDGPVISQLTFDHIKEYLPPKGNYTDAFKMFQADDAAQPKAIQSFWQRVAAKKAA